MQKIQQNQDKSCFHFSPFKIQDSSTLTPDNPQFFKFDLNIAILTKYGRYVYIRHGNQEKCSSFFATLCTIVNKLELSFGKQQSPARLKKIRQGKLTFYVLRRKNYMYICWTKVFFNELSIYSAIQFLQYQLTSSLTQKVNSILNQNQTYDPTINFGKGRAIHNLLSYSILNGLYSLPILFNSLPVLTIKSAMRSTIYNILKEPKDEQQGILVSILMSMSHLISIWKRKQVQFTNRDFLLLFNLLQTNSTLCKSQNWFPICFPGMDGQTMLFCYLKYIAQDLIHVMVSDESQKFPQLSQICKQLTHNIQQTPGILPSIKTSLQSWIKTDPSLQRTQMFHHFTIVNLQLNQMIQSSGNYFGYNQDPEYLKYIFTYTQLYEQYLRSSKSQKQKLHVQTFKQYICGYYEDGQMLLLFICPVIMDLQECKNVISSILKFVKQQQKNLFITFMK